MATRNASDFAKGDKVTFNKATDGSKVNGKITEIDAKADKVTIINDDGKSFKVKAEKVQKMRGRPSLTDEEKAAKAKEKAKAEKAQTSNKKPVKTATKETVSEAALLTVDEIDGIVSALSEMAESMAEMQERLEMHKAAMAEAEEAEETPAPKKNRFSVGKARKPVMEDADEEVD